MVAISRGRIGFNSRSENDGLRFGEEPLPDVEDGDNETGDGEDTEDN